MESMAQHAFTTALSVPATSLASTAIETAATTAIQAPTTMALLAAGMASAITATLELTNNELEATSYISQTAPDLVSSSSSSSSSTSLSSAAKTLVHKAETPAESNSTATATESRHVIAIKIPGFLQSLWLWQPTFMQGFILGQFSMLVLLVMAIKYILFEEPLGTQPDKKRADEDSMASTTGDSQSRNGSGNGSGNGNDNTVVQEGGFGLSKFMIFSRKPKETKPDDLAEELGKIHKEILSRTSYDLVSHAPETCDWLTVFLAQIIAKFRADAERHDRLVRVISEALNGELRPSVIDSIRITQFSLGSDFLRILNARMVPSSGSLGMRAELDLALHDEITLGFNTRVLINWPRSSVAALPVSMVVSLVKFTGTAAVEFDSASLEPSVSVTILPDYVLEFDVQTLIGSKAKVQNLPMLTSVISRKLQAAFAKEFVMPNEKRIKIKHPFTPKQQTTATASSATTGTHALQPQQQQQQAQGTASHTTANAGRSATAELNRAHSPQGPPVADLPPDYNTQLPPPHPKRTGVISRTGNLNTSPNINVPISMPPRMFTPDEQPPMLFGHHNAAVRAPSNAQQQPWSAAPSVYGMSPQLHPIVGIASGSSLGAAANGSRILSAATRPVGTYSALSHTPGLGLNPFMAGGHAAAPASVGGGKAGEPDADELQVKDSVRQRVNRVIRTVNES